MRRRAWSWRHLARVGVDVDRAGARHAPRKVAGVDAVPAQVPLVANGIWVAAVASALGAVGTPGLADAGCVLALLREDGHGRSLVVGEASSRQKRLWATRLSSPGADMTATVGCQ